MTEKVEIFKLLLNKVNYNKYRHRVDKEIFPEALHDLYESLEESHSITKADVTCRDVWDIHQTRYPTLTEAKKNIIKEILTHINEAESIDEEIADYLINKSLIELKATRIAQAALEIAQGKAEDFFEIQRLIDTDITREDVELVTTNVGELCDDIKTTYKWRFNLPDLDRKVGKVGPSVFTVLAGPVNSGKSLMGISFVFGPDGFAEQGARCLYIGNEESLKRTMMRGVSCYSGMTHDQIYDNPEKAQECFNKIKDNVYLVDDVSMNFNKLFHVMEKIKPDIVVIDMLDKVKVAGTFQRGDEKLGKIYELARELAKKYQCAVFGLSQTNADTFGKLTIDQNELANSRVDKCANADLVLTLGQSSSDNQEDTNFRRINIAKSKLKGNGERVNCFIQPELSRLVS